MNSSLAPVVKPVRATVVIITAAAVLLGAVAAETATHPQRTVSVLADDGSSTDDTNPWS
ncbi:O-antigen ligase [Streptomyces sp. B3I7]|uniref:hypothetical protein n=1 Tax=unclassified Streptomyces TaxID=2593676 RepID=UPI002788C5BD|nr:MULTISPECIES: hypothetical protein [unclassified Streptomyces]MDQ0785231.1 O-antigen ligase [Streptomyces sp. B3I8]MDQ0815156.1 O-antigen ligase [Streptomyces sp. B3I7]